jgi:hypothetical protein
MPLHVKVNYSGWKRTENTQTSHAVPKICVTVSWQNMQANIYRVSHPCLETCVPPVQNHHKQSALQRSGESPDFPPSEQQLYAKFLSKLHDTACLRRTPLREGPDYPIKSPHQEFDVWKKRLLDGIASSARLLKCHIQDAYLVLHLSDCKVLRRSQDLPETPITQYSAILIVDICSILS